MANGGLRTGPEDPTLTSMRGISRHIVRLIRTGPGDREVFAVKETVEEFAIREYGFFVNLILAMRRALNQWR